MKMRMWDQFASMCLAVVTCTIGCAFTGGMPPRQRGEHLVLKAEGAGRPVVAVLGANGRTGSMIVEEMADEMKDGTRTPTLVLRWCCALINYKAFLDAKVLKEDEDAEALARSPAKPRALTRSGKWKGSEGSKVNREDVEVGQADVTDSGSLALALAGVSAVVFAAAYSRGKTEPKDVDNGGLVKCAKVVLEKGIERLVVVSSASVTRPYAPVGVLLNTIGSGVLSEKLKGEEKVKELFENAESTYTIVRPGGLTMDPPVGFAELQFNQGDTYVGNVPRADVAAVCAVAATDPLNSGANKTFEMFKARTREPLLPWYRGKTRYVVGNIRDCSAMLARLRPDKEVYDVPGMLPISLADFALGWARK
ncbi:unnamed protein product [Durusdinium trenchii]|uniref:NAD(P)-binding domain-containing protein n=3 Tax=Durusdinium trenchii TaxID=1381693 RepID=A0ABP0T0L9_9DINO